jgi:hypothetical protein
MHRHQAAANVRPVLPDYGVFLHWPETGHAWIHPDDVAVVSGVVPSDRVYRRYRFDGLFYHFDYGCQLRFRARPVMWMPLAGEGFDIDDLIEIRSLGFAREAGIARIQQVRFCRKRQIIEYHVASADGRLSGVLPAACLRQLGQKNPLRSGEMGHTPPRWRPTVIEPGLSID